MSESKPHSDNDFQQGQKYDSLTINVSAVMKWGIAFVALVILVFIFIAFLFNYYVGDRQAGRIEEPQFLRERRPPSAPRVDVNLPQQLEEMRENERARLNSYGWIDRDEGVARIPIDRAMDLFLEKGVSVREGRKEADTENQPSKE